MKNKKIVDTYQNYYYNHNLIMIMKLSVKNSELETKIRKLPNHIIQELNDFVDYLIIKYVKVEKRKKGFKFNWEGGLQKIRKKYTSVELQHKSLDWR